MREYEASHEAWRIQRGSALLLARDLMSDEDYRRFDDFVHRRLQERTLEPLRECLRAVYSASRQEDSDKMELACDLEDLLQSSGRCSAAVVEALYVFAETSVTRAGADSPRPEDTRRRVDDACP